MCQNDYDFGQLILCYKNARLRLAAIAMWLHNMLCIGSPAFYSMQYFPCIALYVSFSMHGMLSIVFYALT
jgi:hypothetical protein